MCEVKTRPPFKKEPDGSINNAHLYVRTVVPTTAMAWLERASGPAAWGRRQRQASEEDMIAKDTAASDVVVVVASLID